MAGHSHEGLEKKPDIQSDLQKPLKDVSSSTELETILSTLGAFQFREPPALTTLLLADGVHFMLTACTGRQHTTTLPTAAGISSTRYHGTSGRSCPPSRSTIWQRSAVWTKP